MKLFNTEIPRNHHYDTPPRWWRELNALKATAIDASKYPILSRHWPNVLVVGGQLACNDDSPLTKRFNTTPLIALKEPGQ